MLRPKDLLKIIRADEKIAYFLFVARKKPKQTEAQTTPKEEAEQNKRKESLEDAELTERKKILKEWLQQSDEHILKDLEVLSDVINKRMMADKKISKHEQIEIANGLILRASIVFMLDNTQINPMLIINTLGAGGKGTVKRAVSLRTGEFSAVKVSPQTSITDTEPRREIQTLKSLHRLQGQQERDAKEAKKNPGKKTYIQQELIYGPDLDKLADSIANVRGKKNIAFIQAKPAQKSEMSKEEFKFTLFLLTLTIFEVAKLHRSNLVHTDIKPQNIMYDFSGIQLIDFGGVVKEGELINPSSSTRFFLPPEILNSNKQEYPAQKSMDVYALGITFDIMLAPFVDSTHAWNKFLKYKCPSAQTYIRELMLLIADMKEKNPQQRISITDALSRMHTIMDKVNADQTLDFGSLRHDVSKFTAASLYRKAKL